MALVKCIECDKEVSTDAKACPHCGKPSPQPIEKKSNAVTNLVVGSIVLAIAVFQLDAIFKVIYPVPKKVEKPVVVATPRDYRAGYQPDLLASLIKSNAMRYSAAEMVVEVNPGFWAAMTFDQKEVFTEACAKHMGGYGQPFARVADMMTGKDIASYDGTFGFRLK